jgi:hypothetical protein
MLHLYVFTNGYSNGKTDLRGIRLLIEVKIPRSRVRGNNPGGLQVDPGVGSVISQKAVYGQLPRSQPQVSEQVLRIELSTTVPVEYNGSNFKCF